MSSVREAEELSRLMAEDARTCLELLEEQVASLGTRCPGELLDAYEDVVRYLRTQDDAADSSTSRPDS